MSSRHYELTEREWSIIAPLLPCKLRGMPRFDDRMVLKCSLQRLRTGSSWSDIPHAIVFQRPVTTVSFDGFVPVSGAGCWTPSLRPVMATS